MKIDAVCFDLDGTLIRNTDSVRYLCELNGKGQPLAEIENRENTGELSWIEADHLKASLIEGLDIEKVASEFGRCVKLIHNIDLVLAYLKTRQIQVVLITAGPVQVANVLGSKFGFDAVYGSRYEVMDGTFTGRITHHLGTSGKPTCLRGFCAKQGLDVERCVAIGDSESDLELFKACGWSICVNGVDAAAGAATECVSTDDLADVLTLIQSWSAA